ncbi:MAG: hypothetical protein HYV95_16925 [Opitutae bacterium]|nr:hypothetical protein [Opitutae bacterium]
MDAADLARAYALLGLEPGCTVDELERAFMRKNFGLIKGNGAADTPDAALAVRRAQLRAAHAAVAADLQRRHEADHRHERPSGLFAAADDSTPRPTAVDSTPPRPAGLITPPAIAPRDPHADEFAPFTFDNWKVNVLVPPLLLGFVFLANLSPFGLFLQGFRVWMHEFGHATAAWLTGHRALPLPFGWTPVEGEHSNFVYFGLLFLLGMLFWAGWRERKVWPMLTAVALAALQAYMTWRLPEHRQEFWWSAFGGVGGQFYLSTLFMLSFYVQLPEKFRWGMCRYVFFGIGATAFLDIHVFWLKVWHGVEEIPFGTLIGGEEDTGGDMNKLMTDYGWTKFQIRHAYHVLGNACWTALALTYAAFALRLNKLADLAVAKFGHASAEQRGRS